MLDIETLAMKWEKSHPQDILREITGMGLKWTLAMSFSREDTVILHGLNQICPPVDAFWLDTNLLFPETYAFKEEITARYQVNLRHIQPTLSLEDQAKRYGKDLWQEDPHRCCYLRKVEPLFAALEGYDGWITGIRREQSPSRARAQIIEWDKQHELYKLNPLAFWLSDELENYAETHNIPVNPLHTQGYPSFGCYPCTRPVKPGESIRAGRWEGWDKSECGIHQ